MSGPFMRLVELHEAMGLPPLNKMPAPWEVNVGKWNIRVNQTAAPIDGIAPYHLAAIYDDTLTMVVCSPEGGMQTGLDGKAEASLMEALEAAIRERRGAVSDLALDERGPLPLDASPFTLPRPVLGHA